MLCSVLYLELRSSSDLDLTETIACTDVVSNSLGGNTLLIDRPGLYQQHEVGDFHAVLVPVLCALWCLCCVVLLLVLVG